MPCGINVDKIIWNPKHDNFSSEKFKLNDVQKHSEHNLKMSNIFMLGIPKYRQLYCYFYHSFVFALNLVYVIMLIAFALEHLSVILDWKCKWNELMKIFYIWTY